MDIDSLQVKITGESTKAVTAVDNLVSKLTLLNDSLNNFGNDSKAIRGFQNLSTAFENLNTSIGTIDTQKLKDMSSAIRNMSKSFDKLNDSINSINFTKAESAAEHMSKVVSKEIDSTLSGLKFDNMEEVTKALKKYGDLLANDGSIRDKVNAMNEAADALHRNASEAHEASNAYKGLIEYIQSTNSSNQKIYLPFTSKEFQDAYNSMRSTLGKAFTTDKAFGGSNATDIISYVEGLNGYLGNIVPISENAANTFQNLVTVLQKAKEEFNGNDEAVKRQSVSLLEAREIMDAFAESILKEKSALQQGDTSTLEYSNNMETIVDNINKLGSIQFPDMAKFNEMVSTIKQLGGAKVLEATNNLPQLTNSLQALVTSMNGIGSLSFDTSSMEGLLTAINQLGKSKSSSAAANIPFIADGLKQLVSSMNQLGKLNFDVNGLSDLVKNISLMGGKSVTNAITNLPRLTTELEKMIQTLSKLPTVNQNLIDTINAIGNLASQGQKVGSSIKGLNSGFGRFGGNLTGLNGIFKRTSKSGKSLAAMFGKMYASYFLLFRAFGKFKQGIDFSSALTEVQNVVNNTFGDMSQVVDDFAKGAITNFGMSELTAKKVASRFQAMGVAMGITDKQVQASNATWEATSDIYNNTAETMTDMSLNLTKLTADLASFYNIEDYEEAGRKLESIFTGTTKPMREWGIDLTQATIKEWALTQGIEANFKTMTQAEKTMLRYQYVMAHTANIQADFIRTSDSWANVTRVLNENFKNLGATIGRIAINAFKPLIIALNTTIIKFNELAKAVSNSLGKIFGWKYDDSKGGITNLGDDADDASDGLSDAATNAKKLKQNLLGIDELNIVNDNSDSDSTLSNLVNGSANGGQWFEEDKGLLGYDSKLDNLYKLGDAIQSKLTEVMQGIQWDKIFDKARNFGTGLADFLNGLISPELFGSFGTTLANELNTVVQGALSFGRTFDFHELGVSIGTGLNNFFSTFSFEDLAETLNTWVDGLEEAIKGALETFDTQKAIDGLRKLLTNLELDTIAVIIGAVVLKKIGIFKASQFVLSLIPFYLKKALFPTGEVNLPSLTVGLSDIKFALLRTGSFMLANPELWAKAWADFEDTVLKGSIFDTNTWDEDKWYGKVDKWLTNGFNNLNQGVSDFFNDPGHQIVLFAKSLFKWELTTSIMDDIKEKFETAFNSKWEEGKGIFTADIGGNIILGILEGFAIPFTVISEPIINFFDNVIKAFCDTFGIHSPAEEMKPYGEFIFLGIIEGFKGKFEEFDKAVKEWWDTKVKPWFTTDKWKEVAVGMKVGIKSRWNEFSDWWHNTGFSMWWKSVTEKFDEKNWTFEGIKDGLKKAWEGAVEAIKGVWNKFADWLNDKLTIDIDTSSVIGKGVASVLGTSQLSLGTIPKFAQGGFPSEDGLFYANHSELVGQFSNGRTAVANNEQIISGIQYGVREAVQEVLAPYLADIARNTRESADKDFSFNIDGREMVSALNNRSARNGFSFT